LVLVACGQPSGWRPPHPGSRATAIPETSASSATDGCRGGGFLHHRRPRNEWLARDRWKRARRL